MFKHILIPTDGADLSRKAVIYGIQLAKTVGAKVTAITISEPYHVASMDAVLVAETPDEHEAQTARIAERALEQVRMAAEAASVEVETVRDIHDQPYRAIIDCARARRCDLIVMASHGRRGVAALLVGSETTKVLTHSTIPVLVYR
jgi:nucleotide-binding universal stress UspA family protein